MSQAGLIDIEASHPQIPTQFDADVGSAVPLVNVLNILGSGSISTSASGNTVFINIDDPLDEVHGGTGQSTYATGDILYASGVNTLSKLPAATDGQVLTLAAGIPAWSANGSGDVVGPASATDNALVRFDGTTGKLIQNGVTTEDDTGNISQTASVAGAALSYTINNTSNTASSSARLIIESGGSSAGDAYINYSIDGGGQWASGVDNSDIDAWVLSAQSFLGTSNVLRFSTTGVGSIPGSLTIGTPLAETSGGTGTATYATGDILYASAANTLSKLTAGSDGEVLTLAAGIPSWATNAGGDVVGPASATDNAIARYDGTTGKLIQNSVVTIADTTGQINANGVNVGGNIGHRLTNTDNTAGSGVNLRLASGGASAGDAWYRVAVEGVKEYSFGIDNDDSDAFVLTGASTLNGSNLMRITTAGAVSIPAGSLTVSGGNLSTQTSTASTTVVSQTVNTDTTSVTSHAKLLVQSGNGSGGDPWLHWRVNGVQSYSMGIDNSDSDALCLTNTSTLDGTNYWRMTTAGERTMPLQPAFLAYLGTTDSNVTGNNTTVTLGAGNALTEVFDQNSDFVTTGTFTAPVTGRYFLHTQIVFSTITTATSSSLRIVTSNRTYTGSSISPTACKDVNSRLYLVKSALADMDAADTCTVTITSNGQGADTVSILGDSTSTTYFCGNLQC